MSRRNVLAASVACLLAVSGGTSCSSGSKPVAVLAPAPSTPPIPPPEPLRPNARDTATAQFQRGKALALAGDSDCARLAFRDALETFRNQARPNDPDDALFAEQLWQSVAAYDALVDPHVTERPPVEDTRDTLLAAENAPSPTAEQVEKAKQEVGREQVPVAFDIPVVVNEAVLRAVAFYQFRTPRAFAGALRRSGRYVPLMRAILREEGLPEDLVYMAMIESAFKSNAHSRARAHGFWQFIDGTAKRYGLRRTQAFDERSDPEKSTHAAARYLKDLYEMFGDWYLAMAAYSAGEGRILRGLQRLDANDYWQLSSGNFLRKETREYVPFVLAAALISKEPSRYGFDVVPDPPLAFDVVRVSKPVDLARVAQAVGAPFPELQLLNSELKTRVTPHGFANYPVRVPAGSGGRLVAQLASLPAAPEIRERRIVARKGDTLVRVAKRAGVSVATLSDYNDLPRNARIRKGQVLLLPARPPARHDERPPTFVASAEGVPKGEIRALPTPAAAVTRADDVPPFTAAAGSSLAATLPARVEIPAGGFEVVPAGKPAAGAKTVRYTVRRGDTLYRIAAKFGLTVDDIRRENGLRAAEKLPTGRRLTLTLALVP
jgi:membrane-bound lytic murein transglycosylase D